MQPASIVPALLVGIVARGLVSDATAADLTLGGGVDLAAGVVHAPGAWTGQAGMRQAEGNLTVTEGGFEGVVALDARVGLLPVVLFSLVPEQLTVGGDTGPVWLQAGIAPAPWRVEAVDGWDNALVTWSMADRRALPGSLLAAEVGVGSRDRGVAFIGGLDLGQGLDLLGGVGGAVVSAPLIAGVHGRVGGDGVRVAGGVFAWPDRPAVVGEVDATLDFEGWRLIGQVTGGWNAPFGGHVELDVLPEGIVTPVLRGELLAGVPGAAAGVRVRPVPWLFLKGEMAYADGAPQGWVEAAVYGETRVRGEKR
ncbi:MAG: hypothetical protein Q8P41_07415 [Pseudomonadota bacterium]|nr:hypothetical protein [Pseudomonadota bacterium]